MGLLSWAKRKHEESKSIPISGASYNQDPVNSTKVHSDTNSFKQTQKVKELQFKQELYEEKQRGYEKAAKHRAYEEGKRQGSKGGGGRFTNMQGGLKAVSHSLNNAERTFGFGTSGDKSRSGHFGLSSADFGIGMGAKPKPRNPPQRITTVSRSGVVKITEPVVNQEAQKKKAKVNRYDWMGDLQTKTTS